VEIAYRFFKAEREYRKSRLSNNSKKIAGLERVSIDRPGQILPSGFTRIHAPLCMKTAYGYR